MRAHKTADGPRSRKDQITVKPRNPDESRNFIIIGCRRKCANNFAQTGLRQDQARQGSRLALCLREHLAITELATASDAQDHGGRLLGIRKLFIIWSGDRRKGHRLKGIIWLAKVGAGEAPEDTKTLVDPFGSNTTAVTAARDPVAATQFFTSPSCSGPVTSTAAGSVLL